MNSEKFGIYWKIARKLFIDMDTIISMLSNSKKMCNYLILGKFYKHVDNSKIAENLTTVLGFLQTGIHSRNSHNYQLMQNEFNSKYT